MQRALRSTLRLGAVMFAGTAAVILFAGAAYAADGEVDSHQKISDTDGGFTGTLDNSDWFGTAVVSIGDLDGDDVADVAVGARLDDDGGTRRGAVWILFLNSDGTVKAHQKISDTAGGFTGTLIDNDHFGESVASLGDLDGDNVGDIAVGAFLDDDVASNAGAVWILFLNSDGTVKAHQKITEGVGGFTGVFASNDLFGVSATGLGDLDGDGVEDLAVGAFQDDDGGTDRGAVWILFLNTNGTVKSHQKISDTAGGFTGTLDNTDNFGFDVALIGNLDADGIVDIAVGTPGDDDGAGSQGAVWVLFLNTDGTVKSHQKISETQGGFTGILDGGDGFGLGVGTLGDLDCDGVPDLAAGAYLDDDVGDAGAVWILLLNNDGTVKAHQKISGTTGNFTGILNNVDLFGYALDGLGDLNGDGALDLIVTAYRDDDGGGDRGAAWVLFLDSPSCATVPVALQRFESYWAGDHVEVAWRLIDVEGTLTFEVARSVGTDRPFTPVPGDGVTHRNAEFVFADHATVPGETYRYRVVVRENGDPVASFETTITTPAVTFALEQNHPNPFNPTTSISFSLDSDAYVSLEVYDASGRLVRSLVDGRMTAGEHTEEWDGRDDSGVQVASGAYFYRMTAGSKTLTRKAVLLK